MVIHLFVNAAFWNLEDIIDVQSPSYHADVVHHFCLTLQRRSSWPPLQMPIYWSSASEIFVITK